MFSIAKSLFQSFSKHRYGFSLMAYLAAAVLTGLGCVLFMRAFEFVLRHRLDCGSIGGWAFLSTPILFLLAVELIRRTAPSADGTGIPQVIFAVKHLSPDTERTLAPLTSPRTMTVKIVALLIGLLAGASTGREGPTVHIAACIFMGVLVFLRKVIRGFEFDLRSAAVAGGAAGLAAAFNTPLAGITFAIEELTVDYFGNIKDFVIMAIVIAAIAAHTLYGEYNYFGKLLEPPMVPLYAALLIGLAGGLLGVLFSTAIIRGGMIFKSNQPWRRYATPIALSLLLITLARLVPIDILGPGNEAAKRLLNGDYGRWVAFFPFAKLSATLLTYWSGIAGGIFAPSLSIGASLGSTLGDWLGVSTATCALIGMAAFLSATIQAPITAFVIIFEMTGHHQMLVPIMLGSVVAFMVARLLGAKHLYQALSLNYQFLLEPNKS